MSKIETIARALFVDQGHVLLTRKIGRDYTFLPGGHVEFGEQAKTAIARELHEEFRGKAEIGPFVGTIEHSFTRKSKFHHEYNLLFLSKLLNYNYPQVPQSRESNLEFLWQPIAKLERANLLPAPLVALIPVYHKYFQNSLWISIME